MLYNLYRMVNNNPITTIPTPQTHANPPYLFQHIHTVKPQQIACNGCSEGNSSTIPAYPPPYLDGREGKVGNGVGKTPTSLPR